MADDASPDIETRALAVAMDLLSRQVSDLTSTLAKNSQQTSQDNSPDQSKSGGSDKQSKSLNSFAEKLDRMAEKMATGTKLVTDPLAMLAGKFTAILGPMAVFSQILESNSAGFGILAGSVKLLASVFAPILLPVVAVLAAGLVELSDKLWDDIEPALEDFYASIIGTLVPAVEAIVDAFMQAVKFFESVSDPLGGDEKRKKAVAEGRAVGMTDEEIRIQARAANWSEREINKALRGDSGVGPKLMTGSREEAEKMAAGGGGSRGPGSPAFKSAMGDVLKELRLSMGPRASIGDIGSVGKNFQLAAINQSPFEAKMLERMDKAVSALEKVAGARPAPAAVHMGDGADGAGRGALIPGAID